jgi:hypothetical protein
MTSAVTGRGVKELFRDAAKCADEFCVLFTPAVVAVRDITETPMKGKCGR